MQLYIDKLQKLKDDSVQYFETDFDSEEDDSLENIRIKTELIELIGTVKGSQLLKNYTSFKSDVIEFLCEISGCAEDLEVLEKYSPSVLSAEEIKFIINNSALARWF